MTGHILELTQRYPPALGGVEQHVQHLSQELRRGGFAVDVVTSDLDRDRPFRRLPGPGREAGPRVRRHRAVQVIPAPHGLGIVAPGLGLDALTSRCDLIHAHAFGYFPTWVGALARTARRRPLVITPHSDPGRGTSGSEAYGRMVTWATLRKADRVVAQSQGEADRLRSLGVRSDRLTVIPTPVDLTEFAGYPGPPVARERLVVLFVGRLYLAQKGLDLLLRAVAGLPKDIRVEVRLVGEDWGDRARLQALTRMLGLEHHVVLTGALPRAGVLAEFSAADLFVLPSRFDSFPVVLLEAMASGLPVLATRVGAVAEVVREDVTGVTVPPQDVAQLSEALGQLLSDPERRRRLGRAGADAVRAYSWEALGPKYCAMFDELVHAS